MPKSAQPSAPVCQPAANDGGARTGQPMSSANSTPKTIGQWHTRPKSEGNHTQQGKPTGVICMSNAEPVEVSLRIMAALDYARANDAEDVRAHYLSQVKQITDVVGLADLTTSELVTLATLLAPAHSRVLTGSVLVDDPAATGKLLRLIRDEI